MIIPDFITSPLYAAIPAAPTGGSSGEICAGGTCKTAIGNINASNPTGLISDFAGLALGLAGTVAILLIIYGGYMYMISRGDQEKLKSAKEIITAAIIGLLFIIFSFVILQTIAGDILRIPGFGSP